MPIFVEPPDDGWPFDRPGSSWTPEERLRVKVWLNTPPQIGQLLRYTAHHLGRGTTPEDAEETWGTFVANELDRTIDLYDPSRSPFQPFLLMRLRQLCWRRGEGIRGRGEEPLVQQNSDGEPFELDVIDRHAQGEEEIVAHLDLERSATRLRECLASMPPIYRTVIVKHYIEEKSTSEIARELGMSEVTVRVRLWRGRRRLRKCLDPDANTGHTLQ